MFEELQEFTGGREINNWKRRKEKKTYKITQNIIRIYFFQMDTKKIKKKSKKSKKEKDDMTTHTVGEEIAVEIRHEPAVTGTCAAEECYFPSSDNVRK